MPIRGNDQIDPDEALGALERFVVDNDELLELEARIGRFNIFDALHIARAEIRHSNFLAFILDPVESHGQSQLFLKALLMDLLKAAPPNLRPLSPIDIDGIDLRGVTVRREWEDIDLLIVSDQPSFVVAIENKIDSSEHSQQLSRYKTTISQHYPNARPLYVFLTPDGAEASEPEWVSYAYSDVHRVLTRVRSTYANAIGDDVLVFLDHYLNLIGTRLMDDEKITDLCQRIYKNHRQALQLIYDRVGSPTSGLLGEVEAALREDERWNVFYRSGGVVDFIPKPWMQWIPPLGTDRKEHPESWFILRFEALSQQLDFYAEIRKMSDSTLRRAVIDMLFEEGPKFGLKLKTARTPKEFYTRVSSRERVLVWTGDEHPDANEIRAAVKKKLDDLHPKLAGLPDSLRRVLKSATDSINS
ncbi:MAG TPA: PD-(D/E)XK nuclease family protein [Tepidisphaeraceae bacterium]|jgi:hypothetical protein|nr:PD-(D/E)XK nuclease family protein [Tepidisphaeraceae bacterium]